MDKEKYRTIGNFIGSSGVRLNAYSDFMQMFDTEEDLKTIFIEIERLANSRYVNLIGMETFGAIATAWGRNYKINPLYLLKQRWHGNRKRLYGVINKGFPTFLLDDVITTGTTIVEAIKYLSGINIKVNKIIALKSKLKEVSGIKVEVVD